MGGSSWKHEARALARLALPMVVVNLGLMAMGLADTAMVGHVGEGGEAARELAAVGLGHLYSFFLLHLFAGVFMALDPVIAQAFGAGDERAIRLGFQRALLLVAAATPPAAALMLFTEPVLSALGQDPGLLPTASDYVFWAIPSIPAFFASSVARQTLQALHRLRPLVISILGANLLNLFLNWVFIFGNLGFPAMGAVGSSVATTLVRWAMALSIFALAWPIFRPRLRGSWKGSRELLPLLRLLRVGLPISFHLSLEFLGFASVMIFMGWIGEAALAGHQVTIQLATFSFMVPLALSSAAAVRVGGAIGKGDGVAMRQAARVSLWLGVGVMVPPALLYLCIPSLLGGLFSPDPSVLRMARSLLPVAGAFQVFDGLQVVANGILRGMADTLIQAWVNLFGFGLLGLGTGLLLAFPGFRFGPEGWAPGLWWGLVLGLFVMSLCLLLRILHRFERGVGRLHLDEGRGEAAS